MEAGCFFFGLMLGAWASYLAVRKQLNNPRIVFLPTPAAPPPTPGSYPVPLPGLWTRIDTSETVPSDPVTGFPDLPTPSKEEYDADVAVEAPHSSK